MSIGLVVILQTVNEDRGADGGIAKSFARDMSTKPYIVDIIINCKVFTGRSPGTYDYNSLIYNEMVD